MRWIVYACSTGLFATATGQITDSNYVQPGYVQTTSSSIGQHIRLPQMEQGHTVLFAGKTIHRYDNFQPGHVQDYHTTVHFPIFGSPEQPFIYTLGDSSFYVDTAHNHQTDHLQARLQIVSDGRILHQEPLYRFHYIPDTLLRVPVFNVNPVVSSGHMYGGWLSDRLDNRNDTLDAEMMWVTLPFRYDSADYLYPNTTRFRFGHVSPPNDGCERFKVNQIPINRSSKSFETVQVFYHLSQFVQFLQAMQFQSIPDSILIDTHAYYGRDISSFTGYTSPPRLEFGYGGVDDAEDAQVVIHEFTHALIDQAAPDTYLGDDRKSMEEGYGDYLAMSYSEHLTGKKETDVFSWDAHNEFWDGFIVNSPTTYRLRTGKMNHDREIWSSFLTMIAERIGRTTTDELVLESLYYLQPNITMPEMGSILLHLDTVLHLARNSDVIQSCMMEKEFRVSNPGTSTNDPAFFRIRNSTPISGHPLTIEWTESGTVEVWIVDVAGRCLFNTRGANGKLEITRPPTSQPGILRLQHTDLRGTQHEFHYRIWW
ncbi:MAG: hypothetical protein KDC76_02835 [Bacteroidetes bacterium]|nr:hypothetical protein [Bacteroidota bacterium]